MGEGTLPPQCIRYVAFFLRSMSAFSTGIHPRSAESRHLLPRLFTATLLVGVLVSGTGCVSQKKYTAALDAQKALTQEIQRTKAEQAAAAQAAQRTNQQLQNTQLDKNRLSGDLNQRDKQVAQLAGEVGDRERRIQEMQRILAEKDAKVSALRQRVTEALFGFGAEDVTINLKNGKVYVSLSEQLLFKSGSTKVDPKGQEALRKLAEVLQPQADVNVLVEGHTDNVPIAKGTAGMKDNWDLSVLRATEIARLLTTAGLSPERITAAGRSQYAPVAMGTAPEERQKNRRTEIILAPKLDELLQLLEQH